MKQNIQKTISERLPPNWAVTSSTEQLTVKAPNGRKVSFTLVTRKNIAPKDIPNLVRSNKSDHVLIVTDFLSPRACELLIEYGASYFDRTGNLRLVAGDPAIFLEGRGEKQNPQREKRELKSLKGAAAGRVVRALCDFIPPYGVRALAALAPLPLGTTSRVVNLLEEEALLKRDEKKQIISVDWPALIVRWARDYNVLTSNRVFTYIEPRTLPAFVEKLRKFGKNTRYAVTGSIPGPNIAPARLAMIYVDDAESVAKELDLTPTDSGANVWLLEPYDEVVFERNQLIEYASKPITSVCMSQLAVDLMTSPGRGPQEAQALIEQMKGMEDVWRKPIRS